MLILAGLFGGWGRARRVSIWACLCPAVQSGARASGRQRQKARRVYFGQRSCTGFWRLARPHKLVRCPKKSGEVRGHIDDRYRHYMGIAATGGADPAGTAKIQPGETVLMLGGTGTLGRCACKLARYLGAGKVVAAAEAKQLWPR